jgi:ribonucleoside-diphosphate reductase alpha chain
MIKSIRKRDGLIAKLDQERIAAAIADDLLLSSNAATILKKRYLRRDERGAVAETPKEMFERVAAHVSQAEIKHGGNEKIFRRKFLTMMCSLEFLPNSPTLMNAGLPQGQLSACFVLPVEDSLSAIFEALKSMALIHQSGGGHWLLLLPAAPQK